MNKEVQEKNRYRKLKKRPDETGWAVTSQVELPSLALNLPTFDVFS